MKKLIFTSCICINMLFSSELDRALKFTESGEYNKAVEAFENFLKKNNSPVAQFNLAVFYKNGIGVEKNIEKSKEYFLKSCKGGLIGACINYEKLIRH